MRFFSIEMTRNEFRKLDRGCTCHAGERNVHNGIESENSRELRPYRVRC
jgi:hypothetical protein